MPPFVEWVLGVAFRIGEFGLTLVLIRKAGRFLRERLMAVAPPEMPLYRLVAWWVAFPVAAALLFIAAQRLGAQFVSTRAVYLSLAADGAAFLGGASWSLILLASSRGLVFRNSAHILVEPTAADVTDLFSVRENRAWAVRPAEFRNIFGGDARKLTATARSVGAAAGLLSAPHLGLGIASSTTDHDSEVINRHLYFDLPDDLYAASKALCETTPRLIASQWQSFHLRNDVRSRFVMLFNTVDLVQRHAAIRVLATLLKREGLPPELADDEKLLRFAGFGEWNQTLATALAGAPLALERWKRVLLEPRSDFGSAMALIEPLTNLLPLQITPHGTNTLALWEVLGELRNRFTGHGPIGLLMISDPLPNVKCLHRFFLTAMRDISELDLSVTLLAGRKRQGIDRGFSGIPYDTSSCLFWDPGDGKAVNLYPYISAADGRLLTLNRIHPHEAEYVDFAADGVVEPAFVRRAIEAETFRRRLRSHPAGAIVVSPDGEGHSRSITGAIQGASAGDRIVVYPGVYRENVVIDRDVEITGAGGVEDTVIETRRSSCVSMNADKAAVRGLTLTCQADPSQHKRFAVDIQHGLLVLEDCCISSTSLSCISVHGADAKPAIRRCRIHNGREAGILVFDGATAEIEDCTIEDQKLSGIEVRADGRASIVRCQIKACSYGITVNHAEALVSESDISSSINSGVSVKDAGSAAFHQCRIHENLWCGMHVATSAKINVRDCTIEGNTKSGVALVSQSSATIRGSEVSGNGNAGLGVGTGAALTLQDSEIFQGVQTGITFFAGSGGSVEACDIFGNTNSGVEIQEGGNPTLRGCKIRDGKSSGIYVHDGGQGTVEDCEISGNAGAGISISKSGNPIVRSCRIHDGGADGVFAYEQGLGSIENSEIFGNTYSGVVIQEGGNPTLRGCKIKGGKSSGIYVHDGGQGTVEDCEISGNASAGIEISKSGNPTVRSCRIHDGEAGGVFAYEQGLGSIENSEIFGNTNSGVEIKEGANPTMRGCKIRDGKSSGIYVHDGGQGTLEDCEISGNARAGISISKRGNPTVRSCKIHDGKAGGVFVYEGGIGTVEDTEIYANTLAGVEIAQASAPTLMRCLIHRGKSVGAFVRNEGQGTFESCEIFGNDLAGVEISVGGNPILHQCTVRDGKTDGVFVHDAGRGIARDCDVFGNVGSALSISEDSSLAIENCKIRDRVPAVHTGSELGARGSTGSLQRTIDDLGDILRSPSAYSPREVAEAHMSLADAYVERENYDGLASHLQKAAEHYDAAIRFFVKESSEADSSRAYTRALQSLAEVYDRLGRYDLALKYRAKVDGG